MPTGIDLPGESRGYLGTPDTVGERGGSWYAGSTVILGIGQGYLQVTPLQDARWDGSRGDREAGDTAPRAGRRYPCGWLRRPADIRADPLPFAAALDPVRAGMRGAVIGGTATRLTDLPVAVGAKTGTAQDGSLPGGSFDNWTTAAAPIGAPTVVITALVQGPGTGANSATAVVDDGLRPVPRREVLVDQDLRRSAYQPRP